MNAIEPRGILFTELSDIACPGKQLTLICEINETGVELLRWIINLPLNNTQIRRSIPIEGNHPLEPFIYEDVVFNFSRTSDERTYPFITELLVSEVIIGINGTEVSCSKPGLSDQHTTVIHIIDGNYK